MLVNIVAMTEALRKRTSKVFIAVFFTITALLTIFEVTRLQGLIAVFKPLLIPSLAIAYLFISTRPNRFYLACLFFACASNVFFLSEEPNFLLMGILAFMVQRLLSIIIVARLVRKFYTLPLFIATLPFLFIFSMLINITIPTSSPSFYPTIINALLIAIMAGISLSGYVIDDNRPNSWLAISTLFFVVLVFMFMIEKYFMANVVFRPMSALLFALAHYGFYMFVRESEKEGQFTQ